MVDRVSDHISSLGVLGDPPTICPYLVRGAKTALIDPGPSSVISEEITRIQEAGVALDDITYIVVSHAHMDHAGGAWAAAEQLPRATVLVPTPAVALLQEPSRMVNLSTQLLGALASLWGPMLPVPPARLRGMNPQERVELGDGVVLRFEAAPGHTADQMAVVEEGSGMIFPSDICGMYYTRAGVVLPKGLPGQFNLATSREAIQKLAGWQPAQLLLPHFAPVQQVADFLRLVERTLTVWAQGVQAEQAAGKPAESAIKTLLERIPGYRELEDDIFASTLLAVTVRGFLDYFTKSRA